MQTNGENREFITFWNTFIAISRFKKGINSVIYETVQFLKILKE
ncbi:hypothetical protein ABIB30_003384 [Pedobacter sp. UYP1]